MHVNGSSIPTEVHSVNLSRKLKNLNLYVSLFRKVQCFVSIQTTCIDFQYLIWKFKHVDSIKKLKPS